MKKSAISRELKTFGKAIRVLRKNLKMTQEGLAEACELHPVYISELERGIKNPSLKSILKLCNALKISPAELMSLTFQPDTNTQNLLTQVVYLLAQQSTTNLKKLLAIIKAYSEAK